LSPKNDAIGDLEEHMRASRTLATAGLVLAALLAYTFGPLSSSALADPPGNNGTVKIHEGAGERDPERANDPHVCTFHVHGFNFDGNSSGTWTIAAHPPGGGPGASGTWHADAKG